MEMSNRGSNSLILLAILTLCNLRLVSPVSSEPGGRRGEFTSLHKRSRDAYVTLLYSNYYLAARVLGKTLESTGTAMDRVVMYTDTVSEDTKEVLRRDGWLLKPISKIANPVGEHGARGHYFSGIYSKLQAWNMTEYERVVYLDSDVFVFSNIDHLFNCGTFCASIRHSDVINAGVLVLEPSTAILKDMIKSIPAEPTYVNDDQGFLNDYFKVLRYSPYFNWSDRTRQHDIRRMPAGMNADICIYYSNPRWMFREGELKVLHYTMGPIKPWVWWAHRIFDKNWDWTNVRMKLPSYGHTPSFVSQPVLWAPYPLIFLVFMSFRVLFRTLNGNNVMMSRLKYFNEKFSHFIPLPVVYISCHIPFFYIVPTAMLPNLAEYTFWLWSSFFLLLFMGTHCCLSHIAVRVQNVSPQNAFTSRKRLTQTLFMYSVYTLSHVAYTFVPKLSGHFLPERVFF